MFLFHDGAHTFKRTNTDFSVLDYICCTNLDIFSGYRTLETPLCDACPDGTLSDHRPLVFNVISKKNREKSKTVRPDWFSFDWEAYREVLENQDWTFVGRKDLDPEQALSELRKCIDYSLVQAKLEVTESETNVSPWWNKILDQLLKNKKVAQRRFRKFRCAYNKNLLVQSEKKLASAILDAKNKFSKKLLEQLDSVDARDSKKIFRIMKLFAGRDSKVLPHFKKPNGELTEDDDEKLQVLNQALVNSGVGTRPSEYDMNFHDNIVKSIDETLEGLRSRNEVRLANDIISPLLCGDDTRIEFPGWITAEDVAAKIFQLKKKAGGPDGIVTRVLTEAGPALVSALAHVFNLCISHGKHPREWKLSNITVLFKGGGKDPCDPLSYRPISLTSLVGKLFESLIADFLIPKLEERDFFSSHQGGFRRKMGCLETLTYCHENWYRTINQSPNKHCRHCNLCLMDISRAFDRACRKSILWKCFNSAGIDGNLLLWLDSFLTNRLQRTSYGSTYSPWLPNDNGVPQGGILSPICFCILINDLPRYVDCCISMYADDTVIWSDLPDESQQLEQLNNALAGLLRWSNLWRLDFHPDKTKWVRLRGAHRKNVPCPATLVFGGKILQECESATLLGLEFDKFLTYRPHVDNLISSLRKQLGFMRYMSGKIKGPQRRILRLYYLAICRSKLEYGCELYHHGIPAHQRNTLEWLQKRFAAVICGAMAGSHGQATLCETGLLPLRQRFSMLACKFWSKIEALEDNHRLKQLVASAFADGSIRRHKFRFLSKTFDDISNINCPKCIESYGTKRFKVPLLKFYYQKMNVRWENMVSGIYLRNVKKQWLKHDIFVAPDRKIEKILTQLRLGRNTLNRTRSHVTNLDHRCNVCMIRETRDHFLLHCARFAVQRGKLFAKIRNLGFAGQITSELLLGHPRNVKFKLALKIRRLCTVYITETGRFNTMAFLK